MIGCSQNPGHRYAEKCLKHIQDGSLDPLGEAMLHEPNTHALRRRLAPFPVRADCRGLQKI